jgi:hypothetical protein
MPKPGEVIPIYKSGEGGPKTTPDQVIYLDPQVSAALVAYLLKQATGEKDEASHV